MLDVEPSESANAEPVAWRLLRSAALAILCGLVALSILSILEANTEGQAWKLGKIELVSIGFAAIAFLWAVIRSLRFPLLGFLRPFPPITVVALTFQMAAKSSPSLHHLKPIWLEVLALVVIYGLLVPWQSWRLLGSRR